MKKLSFRLQKILDECLQGEELWDLCCDHGQLGIAAYHSKIFKKIIFVDQVPSIIQELKSRVAGLPVDVICSDAGKLPHKLKGNVVIAGVGGLNMKEMVDSLNQEKKLFAKRLILSPHRDEPIFENRHLFEGYIGVKEFAFYEKEILRFVFVFDRLK
jgi:tRNA (adenine22-N1)-methyltransferase